MWTRDMRIFESTYYRLNRKVQSVIGQWPYQSRKEKILRRSIVVLIMLSGEVCLNGTLFTTDFTLELATEFIPYSILAIIAIVQYFINIIKGEKIRLMLDEIINDWETIKDKDDRLILINATEEGRVYIQNILVLVAAGDIGYLFLTIIPTIFNKFVGMNVSTTNDLPFQFEYFVDKEKYFYPILIHMCIGSMTTIALTAISNAMCMTLLHHAVAILNLAGFQAEKAFSFETDTFDNKSIALSQRKIVRCVEYHQKALAYVKNINELYGMASFISLCLSMLSITISLFFASVFLGTWNFMLKSLVTAGAQMGYIFILVYDCQRITDSGADIFYRAYFSEWYKAPVASRKLLVFVMTKSRSPLYLTGAKIFIANLETYAAGSKLCLSFFTGLCSLQD